MVFSSQNLDIEEKKIDGEHYLYFIFKGKFTEDVSIKSCAAWSKKINSSTDKYTLVWNCLDMDGFETSAKNEWLNTLKLTNDKISKVLVVSDNIIIRGASRLMLKIMSFESELIKTADDLPWNLSLAHHV